MRKLLIHGAIAFVVLFTQNTTGNAQNFNYTLSVEQGTYTPITNGTIISPSGNDWMGMNVRIPLGFSFSYMGSTFDSVSVTASGNLVFDKNSEYCFNYTGYPVQKGSDTTGLLDSKIRYTGSGNILTIEYYHVGLFAEAEQGYFDFKIEINGNNGSIAVQYGTNTYSNIVWNNVFNTCGIINMNQQVPGTFAYLISGTASSPTGVSLVTGQVLVGFTNWPSTGTIHKFNGI